MRRPILGYILIGIGILSLFGNFGFISGDFFLLMVGAVFIAAYFSSKRVEKPIGLLIPGCITMSIGVFSNIEQYVGNFDGPVFFWLLGASFITIHIIHQNVTASFRSTKWALYVGAGLMAFGIFVLGTTFMHYAPIRLIFTNFWPAAFIVGGVFMIFNKKTEKIEESKKEVL